MLLTNSDLHRMEKHRFVQSMPRFMESRSYGLLRDVLYSEFRTRWSSIGGREQRSRGGGGGVGFNGSQTWHFHIHVVLRRYFLSSPTPKNSGMLRKMTSETEAKSTPYLVRAQSPHYRGGMPGWMIVIATWVILYLWGITQLVDGILDWFSYGSSSAPIRIAVAVSTMSVTRPEGDEVEFGSLKYYAFCALGGVISCGTTHTAIVPLDLVKCRIQVNPEKYRNIMTGFRVTVAEEGGRALVKGWAPTLVGYSLQGLGKFGFYEVFKNLYSEMLGPENAYLYRTSLYLAASASAEFIADILLAPMEATKVRVQTSPDAPPTLRGCAPMIYRAEGLMGFYKGIVPLWMRQIPYTMMKFACFERTVELLYKHVVPKPRSQCSKPEQLVVTFIAGYIAGVFCAVVSHPADTVVSKLNQDAGSGIGGIIKKLGFAGLWKGLFPRIIMIGTLTALQWFIYDSVKVALHLPRPPPPTMPESLRLKLEAQKHQH